MTLPFDTATKDFLSAEPEAWLQLCGHDIAHEDIRVDDADLATVETSTDKIMRMFVGRPNEWALSFEFQAGWDGSLGEAIALRWGALRKRLRVPVACAVVLLKSKADLPIFDGDGLTQVDPLTGNEWTLPCRFIRVWELDPDQLLKGPLTLAGLAPVANVTEAQVEDVVEKLKKRLQKERDKELAKKVYVGSRLLMGLRYDEEMIGSLYGENFMAWWSESSVYQAARNDGVKDGLEEGELKGLRSAIKRLGEARFGPIPEELATVLEGINDQAKLDKLLPKILTAESWEQLFGKRKRK
jgi:predicted transposase YdaD